MNKRDKKINRIVAIILALITLFTTIPVPIFANATIGSYSYQRLGITYQFDASFPAPCNQDLRELPYFVHYINQNNSGNLKQAYWIQYGVDVSTGSQSTWQADYNDLNASQKELLNQILVMGYNEQTGTKYGGSWEEEYIATQSLIWIVATNQYGSNWESRIVDVLLKGSPNARRIYNTMRNHVAQFNTIPSFASPNSSSATDHELKYNMLNGRYELTITDTNNVLNQFDFAASGINFTRNGNQLTISTDQILEKAQIAANKNLPRGEYPAL